MSIALGCLTAFLTVFFVISLKTIRHSLFSSIPKIYARCHDIASPSLSGSVASNILSAFFAAFFNLLIVGPLPRIVMYLGLKLFSISTPNSLLGRSLTCPIDATTLYLSPKNLLIVLAFAGDSTIIRCFPIIPPSRFANILFYSSFKIVFPRSYFILPFNSSFDRIKFTFLGENPVMLTI